MVLVLRHHEQGIIVHYYNKGMNGAMNGIISIVKAFARSTTDDKDRTEKGQLV